MLASFLGRAEATSFFHFLHSHTGPWSVTIAPRQVGGHGPITGCVPSDAFNRRERGWRASTKAELGDAAATREARGYRVAA